VLDRVGADPAPFAVSDNGTLMYLDPDDVSDAIANVGWIAPPAGITRLDLPPGRWGDLSLSPDGSRLLMSIRNPSAPGDVWLHQLDRRVSTRLTFDPGEEETPVWSPDGTHIAFSASRQGEPRRLYIKNLESSEDRAVWTTEHHSHLYGWSPDGRYLIATTVEAQNRNDIWRVRVDGSGAETVVDTAFNEGWPALSPDGRWLAFQSDESGRNEVYVQPFTTRGPKHQVSVAGGVQPRWSHDGRRIFFRQSGKFYFVEVTSSSAAELGRPVEFAPDPSSQAGHFNYDVARDGRLMISVVESTSVGQPALVFNVAEEIRRKFAAGR
jgi:Tol biopolymer transport system component